MQFVRRAAIVACVVFAGCLVGYALHWLLPTQDLAEAKGAIATIHGLVTTLLALVLGLLVWTSYGVYSQQRSEAQTFGLCRVGAPDTGNLMSRRGGRSSAPAEARLLARPPRPGTGKKGLGKAPPETQADHRG
jgi:hypothetical protein